MTDIAEINRCPICGGTERCTWTSGVVSDMQELSVEDWEAIYNFMTQVELPFLHGLIDQAKKRKRANKNIKRNSHKNDNPNIELLDWMNI